MNIEWLQKQDRVMQGKGQHQRAKANATANTSNKSNRGPLSTHGKADTVISMLTHKLLNNIVFYLNIVLLKCKDGKVSLFN